MHIHLLCVASAVPTFPMLEYVFHAYSKWEKEDYPQQEFRVGLIATNVHRIW